MKNVLFSALDFKDMYVSYDFVDTINILNIFTIFESMRRHSSVTGALDKNHFGKFINLVRAV